MVTEQPAQLCIQVRKALQLLCTAWKRSKLFQHCHTVHPGMSKISTPRHDLTQSFMCRLWCVSGLKLWIWSCSQVTLQHNISMAGSTGSCSTGQPVQCVSTLMF